MPKKKKYKKKKKYVFTLARRKAIKKAQKKWRTMTPRTRRVRIEKRREETHRRLPYTPRPQPPAPSPEQYRQRFIRPTKTQIEEKVARINREIAAKGGKWVAGVTSMSHLSRAEQQAMLGRKQPGNGRKPIPPRPQPYIKKRKPIPPRPQPYIRK